MESEKQFKDLGLKKEIEKALEKKNYKKPTPIQIQSIPGLLEGKDLIGIAQTGTGKTAAFTLPILNRMRQNKPRKIQTLILAPTRELAAQIAESFDTYGIYLNYKNTTIFGGVSPVKQIRALYRGVDIIIATPGRLLDLISQKKLTLDNIEFFVLDEADRMLDMGFIHDIKKIIAKLPSKKQTLFFSATMSNEINKLANSLLKDPIKVEITPQSTTVERIDQKIYFVDKNYKEELLLDLIKEEHLTNALVFTRTKHKADKVSRFLNQNRIPSDAIHGNKTQGARVNAIKDFKKGKTKVLVATDIAARGIDIKELSHVINYELPNEPESYVHRIGRTARAGRDGVAYSFCAADEREFLRDIEKLTKQKIEVVEHQYHSERAKNAVGKEARQPPRKGGRGRPKRSRGGSYRERNSRDRPKREEDSKRSFSKDNSRGKSRKPFTRNKTREGSRDKPKRDGDSRDNKGKKPYSRGRDSSRGKKPFGKGRESGNSKGRKPFSRNRSNGNRDRPKRSGSRDNSKRSFKKRY